MWVRIFLAMILGTVSEQIAWGQVGSTVAGNAYAGEGRYLRGMAWYEFGTARANAIEADAVFAWNRAVQTDYNAYLTERAQRLAAKKAVRNEREEAATIRMEALKRRWREQPTLEDIRSGVSLNALASDLADPTLTTQHWQKANVELPPQVTIASLAFRFADSPKIKLPSRLAPSTVAVGRMKGDRWPVSLRRPDLADDQKAYRDAIAVVMEACAKQKPLKAAEVDAVRDALFALKNKAVALVPTSGGQRKQALAYLDQLDEATKIFLDRDIAEELIRDVQLHKAKTVGELLGFMKKYRLMFAESDDNPESWAVYQTLYDLLYRQKVSLDFVKNAETPR